MNHKKEYLISIPSYEMIRPLDDIEDLNESYK